MRDKIFSTLVTKFPALSKHFLGLIATQIAKKVTDEEGIEKGIEDFEAHASIPELAQDFQTEQDRQIGLAKKKWQKEPPEKQEPKEVEKPENELLAALKKISDEIAQIKGEKLAESIYQKISSHEKLKGIPASYYNKRKMPEKTEDIDAFIDEVSADYGQFEQELANKGLSTTVKPIVAGSDPKGKEKVSTEMQQYLQDRKQAVETKN